MKFAGHTLHPINVHQIVESIFEKSQHKKRIAAIANAALGVIESASLIVHRIGRGMAKSLNLIDKHAIKQVDRLLSNKKFNVPDCQASLIPFMIGSRKDIKVTMDWTDFDGDSQTTLSLNLVTSHGRATPLLWKTFSKNNLKNNRNSYEDELLYRLREFIPVDVKVTILADRGFCDTKLFDFLLNDLKFHYTIRIRSNILVEAKHGEVKTAIEWVSPTGKTTTLRNAKITHEKYTIPTVAFVHDKNMKQAWCIVSSEEKISGSGVVKWYAKRWGCEPQFRDTKDIYYGMGLSKTQVGNSERRDRILFINAISTIILTLLGAAGENLGLDRGLKANTTKKRTLSLLNQGIIYFSRITKMAKETVANLLKEFARLIEDNKNLTEILGVI